ncbi:MAG: hypothetical protein Q8K72_11245, partial [Acidimicrobiales bacterium]|nr:hypothetical protein [Acidimicrobiales bacterium]
MPRRLLTLWITVLLVGGATMVATQAERATPLTTTAGDLPRPRVIDAITVAPSTTAPAPAPATSVPNSAPRRATTTTTTTTTVSAPLAVPLVAKPAVVDGPGAYIVGRDGTGLRRLFDCQAPLFRTWLGPDVLAVTDDGNDQIPRRIWLDGHTSTFPQPLVAITGATGTLRGVGSIAPGGGRTVISFAQAPSHGVAILDLETGTNRVIVSGDNPTPVWSPTGDILLVGPSGTAVIDERGTILRDWAPSSLSMATMGTFGFSSDGRYVVGADSSDINRWVVLEPRSNQARRVPQVGSGWNQVEWAGTRLVLNDP